MNTANVKRRVGWSLRAAQACALWTIAAASSTPTAAQAPVVNFEPGSVAPIATSMVDYKGAQRHLLFVCNTPDNRLEIFDAEAPYGLLGRVPTGLAPVTVRLLVVSNTEVTAYVCNLLGDSITQATITTTGVASDGRALIRARLDHTKAVGDEPSDIAFVSNNKQAVVSLRSRSAVTILDTATMDVIPGEERHLVQSDVGPFNIALKNPTWMQAVGDRLFILDRSSDSDRLDLFIADSTVVGGNPMTDPAASVTRRFTGNMGNTRFAFAIDSTGTKMFVVGMRARTDIIGEANLQALPTGFAQSRMWVVDVPIGSNGSVRAEAIPGILPGPMPSINLNRDYNAAGLVGVNGIDSLAQPTGITLLEDGAGNVTGVVLTAFSSDKVAVLTPSATAASGWDINQVTLQQTSGTQTGYSMVGPRAAVLNSALTAPNATQPGVVFVANTLDNSVSVMDPFGLTEFGRFQLPNDPTLPVVRAGRQFLYGAQHSGNKTVSCSSCHIDGHTDGIGWDLSTPGMPGAIIQNREVDKPQSFVGTAFPGDKGPMITQSLRGLVNYHIAGEGQTLATNAPYHWRGDRPTFQDFNGAFSALLGGSDLSTPDIDAYTDFIETIPHPPNPEQPRSRAIIGDLGTQLFGMNGAYYDSGTGDGAARGMQLFHTETSIGELSCVLCHSTPEGSNNRITEAAGDHPGVSNPTETAALRHMFDREAFVVTDFSLPVAALNGSFDDSDIRAKVSGLFHHPDRTITGGAFGRSINQFTGNRFLIFMPGPNNQDQVEDMIEFVRTLDTGSAPVIGLSDQLDAGSISSDIALMIDQAGEANCGVVVWVGLNGIAEGWWLDVAAGGIYRQAGTSMTTTIVGLQGRVSTSTVVEFLAVPVGGARTIAAGGVSTPAQAGPAPSSVTLEPMTMATQWARAARFAGNWHPSHDGNPFNGAVLPSHRASLSFETALVDEFVNNGLDLGVQEFFHEPPRRMRIAGDDIRYGAIMTILMPKTGGGTTKIQMPLFPTEHMTAAPAHRIWETAVEFDGEITLALLHGGPFLDHVQEVRDFETPSAPLDPANDNSYTITVTNEDGTSFGPFTAQMTVQRDR